MSQKVVICLAFLAFCAAAQIFKWGTGWSVASFIVAVLVVLA